MGAPPLQLLASVVVLLLLSAVFPTVRADADVDWLVQAPTTASTVTQECWPGLSASQHLCGLALSNGLVTRRFVTSPAFGSVDFVLNATAEFGGEQSMFRTTFPEATVTLNGTEYVVGGLEQVFEPPFKFLAYCNRTRFAVTKSASANVFSYASHSVSAPVAPFPWTPGTRGSPKQLKWPPPGVHLAVNFAAPAAFPYLNLTVHYELYDGVPLLSKWVSITSTSATPVQLSALTAELVATLPPFGSYPTHGSHAPFSDGNGAVPGGPPPSQIHAKTDQAHGSSCTWQDDFDRSSDPVTGCSSCRDEGAVEPVLNCSYNALGAYVSSTTDFTSFRALVMATDSTDVVRHTLSRHRIIATLAPHTFENPIFFHATAITGAAFTHAIDQLADVGFEMLIYSFGSGFDLESTSSAYLQTIKGQISYAHSKDIEVGGYDLICLDRGNVGPYEAVDANGHSIGDACFASMWTDKLENIFLNFINQTGLSMVETDGPYGGEACYSTSHAHHQDGSDSVYHQERLQNKFYHRMRELGVYVNAPDNYFFAGSQRTGIGYDEQQYSLPRSRDLSITRMGMSDDLQVLSPTQGWTQVPIAQYHAGGAAASFLGHPNDLEFAFSQYMGAGVAACYRGSELFATNTTRDAAIKWVSFYKAHRGTLVQPVQILRRPTMQSWDGFLHVNPFSLGDVADEIAVAMLYNPTMTALTPTISVPLYYAGIGDDSSVMVSIDGATPTSVPVKRDRVSLSVSMPASSSHTVVFTRASQQA